MFLGQRRRLALIVVFALVATLSGLAIQRALSGRSKAPFAGWVNGIYIYPDASNAPAGFVPDKTAGAGPACPGPSVRVVSEDELKASDYYIDIPAWMPPETVEQEAISGGACGAKIVVVSRQFQVGSYGAQIGLVLRPGARSAQFPAVAEQVRATTVNGRPAVAITPLADDGSGNSAIFILTDKGLLQVGDYGVRFADLRRVAESLK